MINKWKDPDYKKYMKEKNDDFFKSDKGKEFIKKLPNMTGFTHSEQSKKQMSESAKVACSKIDCKERVAHKIKYFCPLCNIEYSLNGGWFNLHMQKYHSWNKEECQLFKSNYPLLINSSTKS